MIMNRKKSLVLLLGLLLSAMVWVGLEQKAKAQEPIVIVIDPGHGGENRGGEYEQYVEKEMNPIVAAAMKEELEKYENVTVYLTHEQDVDMSIKDRVLFAKEKEADFCSASILTCRSIIICLAQRYGCLQPENIMQREDPLRRSRWKLFGNWDCIPEELKPD